MDGYTRSIVYSNDKTFQNNIIQIKTSTNKGMMKFDINNCSKMQSNTIATRIKSAFKFLNLKFPYGSTNVSTTCNSFPRSFSYLDLPIAISILVNQGLIPPINNYLFLGELSIDASLKEVHNPHEIIRLAIKNNISNIVMPVGFYGDLSIYKNINIYFANNLGQVINHIRNLKPLSKVQEYKIDDLVNHLTINDLINQPALVRALTIAVAGKHNLLIKGPIGCGKTLSISTIQSILPNLDTNKILDLNSKYSSYFDINSNIKKPLTLKLDFNMTTSQIFGSKLKTGYITLADNGYIILDEINLFKKSVLDSIKILMDGSESFDTFSSYDIPYNFSLIGIMNPCPCGNLGTNVKCTCSQGQIAKFNKKIDDSFLDRIHMKIYLNKIKDNYINNKVYNIAKIENMINSAQKIQNIRYNSNFMQNGTLNSKEINTYIYLSNDNLNLIESLSENHGLSKRGVDNIIKVARTIADLNGQNDIENSNIYEAFSYWKTV